MIATVVALVVSSACAPDGSGPNIQLAGIDDGVPNCAAFLPLLSSLYIGGPNLPNKPMDERFHSPPVAEWCNSNIGFSTETYGPNGVTFGLPATKDGPFHNNAELLAMPTFEPGQTMTYQLRGTQIDNLNGTLGFGISNRTVDLPQLEIAWFMYNWTDAEIGPATQQLAPLFNLLGMDFPRGFFLMVKRKGELLPQIRLIDPNLLKSDHSYAVKLGASDVKFYVDGTEIGSFGRPPTGLGIASDYRPLPLVGQLWIDAGYWFPIPIPQWNDTPNSVTMTRYLQGPSETTPLVVND